MIDKNTEQSMDRTEYLYGSYITCSSDLKMVAITNYRSIQIIDPFTKRQYPDLVGNLDRIFRLEFSPDNKLLASVIREKTLRIWDPYTGQQLHEFLQDNLVNFIRFSPDMKSIIAAGSEATIRIWNLRSQQSQQLIGHRGKLYHIQYAPNGRQLISGGEYGLYLWDTKRLAKLRQVYCTKKKIIFCVTIRNQIVVAAGIAYRIRIYNLRCFKLIRSFKFPFGCWCKSLCFSPNFDKLAAAFQNRIYSWDIQGNSRQLLGHDQPIHYLNFLDDQFIISAASDSLQVQLC